MNARDRRVLVAVEPYLLATVLARLLERATAAGAVEVQGSGGALALDTYDAAIFTGTLPPGVRAGLLILLPGEGSQEGTVTTSSATVTVTIEGVETIVRLLDERLPRS